MGQSSLYLYLSVLVASFTLSLLLTPIVKKIAIKTGLVSAPKDNRWHQKETALLGGVSIFCVMTTVWILSSACTSWITFARPYLPMMLCATGIFLLGLADDIFNMDPQHKLAGQVVITSILMFFGFRLEWTNSETINLVLSLLWIIGITNAFNLLDNMDGLAAGIAFLAGAFLLIYLWSGPEIPTTAGSEILLSMSYLGALLGFLVYNFNPASIFMGDAGSLFIGFILACLVTLEGPAHIQGKGLLHLLSVIAIPILILFIPILDTGFVTLMRKLFRRPISQGNKDHSSHRMVAIGLSEKKAVIVLYAFSMGSGLIALAINHLDIGLSLVLIVLYLLFVLFFWIRLAKVKIYPEKSILSTNGLGVFTPILIEVTYRRRLFEVLLDSVLVAIAYYAAYLLRFEGVIGPNFAFFLKSLPIMISCQIFCLYVSGVYRGVWERTGLRDLSRYISAVTAGTAMPIFILLFLYRFQGFSRTVFIIYWVIMLIFLSLSRLSFRLLDETFFRGNNEGKPTIVYGAGVGGQMAVKEIETNRGLGLTLLGFIDDDPNIQGRRIQGYPVFGGQRDLEKIIKKYHVKKIIISFKKNGEEKKHTLKALCLKIDEEIEVGQMKLTIT